MTKTVKTKDRQIVARKQPRQKRSQEMVERILGATRELLIESGLSAFTTNHVANAAEISVGSLYQYFPNKQAIINELYSRWLGEVRDEVEKFTTEAQGESADEIFEGFFQLIYGGWKEEIEDLNFVRELNAAVKLFPDLATLDQAHGLEMAGSIAGVFRLAGSQKSERELERLGLYMYGLHNAFEDMITLHPEGSESLFQLHSKVVRTVFDQAL